MVERQRFAARDSEVVAGAQGLLLFTPNLQSFGVLPKSGHYEGTSSMPPPRDLQGNSYWQDQ